MQNKTTFRAFRTEEIDGSFKSSIQNLNFETLQENEILVKVSYSSLNYKDALSASGNKGVTRNFPHTAGIDAVGEVLESKSSRFQKEEKVIVTSYDLGMNSDGGFAEYVKVPADWALKIPNGLTEKESMIYGTAGLTAGMSIYNLVNKVKPEDGKIVVSGSTGGVGSIAISILNKLGYQIVAITGKETEVDYLKSIGASEILLRSEIEAFASKPMLKPLFAGAVDTVGGTILENILKSTNPLGVVCCCGNVASPKLQLTIFPFILRGISLIGIDSQNYPMKERAEVWRKLASEWKPENLMDNFEEVKLEELQEKIDLILKGGIKGRVVVALSND